MKLDIPSYINEELKGMIGAHVTGYRLPSLTNPNAHLVCAWVVEDDVDGRAMLDDEEALKEQFIRPALQAIAEEINKHDVVLLTDLQLLPSVAGFLSQRKETGIPIRWTVEYKLDVYGDGENPVPGWKFTVDILADLLDKPE